MANAWPISGVHAACERGCSTDDRECENTICFCSFRFLSFKLESVDLRLHDILARVRNEALVDWNDKFILVPPVLKLVVEILEL